MLGHSRDIHRAFAAQTHTPAPIREFTEKYSYLDLANGKFLESNKSPSRKVGELDNRGSHFYLALYWAESLAEQSEDQELQAKFRPIAKQLRENEAKIVEELLRTEGKPVDIGGYYHPNPALVSKAMRPSQTFNAILSA